MPKSPEEMEAAMIRNLEEKTGKSLSEWLKIAQASGQEKHGALVKHLKTEHGVTHGYAGLSAHRFRRGGEPQVTDVVAAQYSGRKASLRPIYDALLDRRRGFGDELEVSPKKAYVSLRRNKQFGIVQPSTRTRVDVGINLKGVEPTERLEASGSFNSMVSHRVRVTGTAQVDDELVGWLRQAYDQS